ncbi:MAG: hypothetical protein HWE39_14575 [Oceanospirillaceae bacterium]|nr:hypothetical protein [Oceanospirillaceae bacterium]
MSFMKQLKALIQTARPQRGTEQRRPDRAGRCTGDSLVQREQRLWQDLAA